MGVDKVEGGISDENKLDEKTPDEMIETAKSILSAHLEDELLGKILNNSPEFFEKIVAKVAMAELTEL